MQVYRTYQRRSRPQYSNSESGLLDDMSNVTKTRGLIRLPIFESTYGSVVTGQEIVGILDLDHFCLPELT